MSRLVWDKTGEHFYETGIKDVALYVWDNNATAYKKVSYETASAADSGYPTGFFTRSKGAYVAATGETPTEGVQYYQVDADSKGAYSKGVAWNGITAVNETPTGAEATDLFADDKKYLSILSAEELEGTIEAYTYPDEWEECDGSADVDGIKFGQQSRKQFCLAYTTTLGNDTENNDYGKKLHILYNGKASPSERAYATINDSPEAITFSWSLKATKEAIDKDLIDALKDITGFENTELKDTALITITDKESLYDDIEDVLYGSNSNEPTILLPDDIIAMIIDAHSNTSEGGEG